MIYLSVSHFMMINTNFVHATRMYDVCVSEGCKGMETLLSKLNTVPIHNWIMCTLEWLRHFHALFFPKYKKKPFAAEPLAK